MTWKLLSTQMTISFINQENEENLIAELIHMRFKENMCHLKYMPSFVLLFKTRMINLHSFLWKILVTYNIKTTTSNKRGGLLIKI